MDASNDDLGNIKLIGYII